MHSHQRRNKKHRPYSIKKTGIKDENIDRQIIAIYKAVAHKLLANQALVEQIKHRLESQREQGMIGYSQFICWLSILEIIDDTEAFIKAMTEDTPKMRRWRRKTPFSGVLTEEERQQAITAEASGMIDSVAVLL